MRLSLNEIEVTARKAALGAGLSLGLAEEAGAAAAWLAAAGFPVATLLAAALETSGGEKLQLTRTGAICRLTSGGGACSALRASPSACDLVIAATRSGERIVVDAVIDVPALAIAQAVLGATESDTRLAVEIGRALRVAMAKGSAIFYATMPELATLRCRRVRNSDPPGTGSACAEGISAG